MEVNNSSRRIEKFSRRPGIISLREFKTTFSTVVCELELKYGTNYTEAFAFKQLARYVHYEALDVYEQHSARILGMSQPHFGLSVRMQLTLPKVGDLESSGTPENSEDDLRGQISLHWCILYINGKFLKFRCPKWPRMGHLDIFSSSYGQKKGRESNYEFDSRPLKVRNRPLLDVTSRSATRRWKALDESYNFGLDLVPIRVWSEEL